MARLVLPNGTAAGRGHGWKPSLERPGVQHFGTLLYKGVVPRKRLSGKVGIPKINHPKVRDQLEFGSCTGQGVRTALQTDMRQRGIFVNKAKRQEPELSARHAYLLGRIKEASRYEDAGCEIVDVVNEVAKHGCAPEELCPYPQEATKQTWAIMCQDPSEEAKSKAKWHQIHPKLYKITSVDDFLQALANKIPVVGGFICCTHTFDRADGFLLFPTTGEEVDGGHCVCFLEADCDKPHVETEFPNSWGESWGTNGYGKLELSRWFGANYLSDCWAVRHE